MVVWMTFSWRRKGTTWCKMNKLQACLLIGGSSWEMKEQKRAGGLVAWYNTKNRLRLLTQGFLSVVKILGPFIN